jgi:hypothetical protein
VVDGTDDDVLQNDSEEEGGVRSVCVGKMKALTMKMEKVTLNGKSK